MHDSGSVAVDPHPPQSVKTHHLLYIIAFYSLSVKSLLHFGRLPTGLKPKIPAKLSGRQPSMPDNAHIYFLLNPIVTMENSCLTCRPTVKYQ